MTQGGIELVTAYVSIVPEGSKIAPEVRRQFGQVGRDADKAGRDSGKRFSGGFSGALKRGGGLLIGGGLGLGIAGLVKSAVTLEASFSKTMAQVAASTGAPKAAIGQMTDLAMKLGAETKFSANEAAGAMLELGKAGISTSDIMGGALKGTLLLAAAGDTDLATAATIASNAMNTFNLKGEDMNTIAAALAGGANASSASVESLGQALQQVGPGATNAGLSLQETVGALSAFDASGIKGSDAGTSLKTMLARLVPQTDAAAGAMRKLGLDFTDAKGNFVPITNVAQQLQDKLGKLSQEQRTTALTTIFGSDATRAATVLMKQGAKGLGAYIKATKDQNAAQKLAKANMSGTAGALERLRGSVETAELALGKALAPTIAKTADFLSEEAVPAMTDFIKGMQDGTGAGGDVADVLKDILSVGKGAVEIFDSLPGPVKKFGVELLIASIVVGKMNSGLAGIGGRLSTFTSSIATAETRSAKFKTTMQGVGAGLRNIGGAGGMLLLADSTKRAGTSMGVLESAAGGALSGAALGAFGGPVGAGIGAGIGGIAGASFSLIKGTKGAGDAAKVAIGSWKDYTSTLEGVSAATTKATRDMVFQRLESSGLLKATRDLGLSDREAVNAVLGNKAAREKLSAAVLSSTAITFAQKDALEKETGAIGRSRLAQLQKNVAIAQNATELRAAQVALKSFMAEPASKRVSITGVEQANAQLRTLLRYFRDLKSVSSELSVGAPANGLGGLLDPHRATGGPVIAGQPYIVGERRPELFVPNQSGRIIPRVPTANASGSGSLAGQRLRLVVPGGEFDAYIDDRADGRVGAQRGIDSMTERAFG